MVRMRFKTGLLAIGLAAGSALACNGTITPDNLPINNPDIHGVAVFLPEILENAETGPFPGLLKTINKYYPEGKISISIEPVKRVYLDTNNKNADFRFPIMKISEGADNYTPYQFSKEMLGKVSFVLYTFSKKPLTKEDILKVANLAKYSIEAPPVNWGFSTKSVVNLEQSLKKLNAGRIDALIWAQEEADYIIKKFKLNQIHRAHFDDYPDVLFLSCNQRGDFVNNALSKAIAAARASGELQKAYIKVHKPYQDWQP
ncbi:transporter substrate-binding domain-containing protein [Iodobacter sp. LRB]|uniref:transporter substrate-binding domain-containing protein n=1 Tax=unclassified Iodobacter TaxID=235634 RepID=UPI00117A6363|nr:transporter substrate-binding domain-containing protein [Iodobacter sp. BJB302]